MYEKATIFERETFLHFYSFVLYLYHSSPLLKISCSPVLVIHWQFQSNNMKWKIPEKKSCFKLCAILNSVMKSQATLFCPTWDMNHPLFCLKHLSRLCVLLAQQLLSSHLDFQVGGGSIAVHGVKVSLFYFYNYFIIN